MADFKDCGYSCSLLLNVMFRPLPPTSLSLPVSFIRWICHHIFIGLQFYDYYDFICKLLIHIPLSPELLGNLMSMLHSYHINSSSPGKNNTYFTTRLPSLHMQFYVKDIGFRWSEAPYPLHLPYEGSLPFRR